MIAPAYCQTMARYNAWQNQSIYQAANGLSAAARGEDRGAVFGSILGTLSHLHWADLLWMSRFDGGAAPAGGIKGSEAQFDWSALMAERPALDARIAGWAWGLGADDLAAPLAWFSGALGRAVERPMAECVVHFFNHQTHHRGQVHAMLTAAGARPGDTDLFILPDEVPEWR